MAGLIFAGSVVAMVVALIGAAIAFARLPPDEKRKVNEVMRRKMEEGLDNVNAEIREFNDEQRAERAVKRERRAAFWSAVRKTMK